MDDLETIVEEIRQGFEETHGARELALKRSRELIRICAKTIRAAHRQDWEQAQTLLAQATSAAQTLIADSRPYPALYHAGYTQDSLKEYVEAELTLAMLRNQPLPSPRQLDVEQNTYLNGLAEAATELRRRILDILRHGHDDEAERLLDVMDDVYSHLVTFDFSDSITGGLRRRTDTVRAVLERTRGDLTSSYRQHQLQLALQAVETQFSRSDA